MTTADPTARPNRSRWLFAAAAVLLLGAFLSLAALYLYLRSTHRPLGQSGPARSVSTEQAALLLQELAKHPARSLTIKTDASDHEANQVAQQLYQALGTSQWHVDLSTADTGPAIGTGLCVVQTGEDSRPAYADASQDPYFYLRDALDTAHLDVACESGQSSGEYKLYLVVGHREQTQSAARHGFILRAAGRWALRHLKALRGS